MAEGRRVEAATLLTAHLPPKSSFAKPPSADIRLARLKPEERTALSMRAAGFSYKEIAERKDWTHTKVNRCLAEGRAKLRGLAA